jgi:hypothetical protein
VFPLYLTWSNKWRLVNDYAFPRDDSEINSWIPMVALAVLRLVQHDQIFEALCTLIITRRACCVIWA